MKGGRGIRVGWFFLGGKICVSGEVDVEIGGVWFVVYRVVRKLRGRYWG